MKRINYIGASCLTLLVAVGAGIAVLDRNVEAQSAPTYRNVPLWPRPFPDDSWVIGSVTGVATDAQNNVWVVHRGTESLENNEKGMSLAQPSSSVCCMAAPFVLKYDPTGKLIASWGGPSSTYPWPATPGGITVDSKGNVWITGAGQEAPPPGAARGRGAPPAGAPPAGAPPAGAPPAAAPPAGAPPAGAGRGAAAPPPPPPPPDAHVLKFSNDGRHLLTIGTPGKMDGPDSQTTLNRPSMVAYDAGANEVFVADRGNRRIIVFDADSGAYKRHWFGTGEKAAGTAPGPFSPSETPPKSFRDVTCIDIARDGTVYVCDRSSNRIQAFDKSGKFIKEGFIAKNTTGATVTLGGGAAGVVDVHGSAWDVAFSNDAQQRFMFVADGTNKKVRVLLRDTLSEVGTIGSGGRYPGQFLVVNAVAADAQGNLYTGETHHGKRVQKFTPGK